MPHDENLAGNPRGTFPQRRQVAFYPDCWLIVSRAIIWGYFRSRTSLHVFLLADQTVLIFSVVAVLMVLGALAFVVVPLVRVRSPHESISDAGSNVAIYKSHRRELDEELALGAINEAEHDAAFGELSARVVDEVPEQRTASPVSSAATKRPWWLVAAIAIIIPLGASLLYAAIGAPKGIETAGPVPIDASVAAAHANAKAGGEPPMSDKQILAMVDSLAQKMQQNPTDPRGWILLAKSQNALGRFAEASSAFERAAALQPNDAQLLADFADSAVMAQQGRFEGKPYALIKQALSLDASNLKALALAGTAELRMGNRAASLKHWEKLKTLVPKDSADYRQVEAIIAEVKETKLDASLPATAPMPPPVTPATGSSIKPAVETSAKSGAKVTGKVVVAPELVGKLASGDILFVFARAKEGPRMPLAVIRVPAPKANAFPFAFSLDDTTAMAPGLALSSFAEVVIEARISKSGNAQLQPGDLSGVTGTVKPGASGITVTIGKVAP